MRPRQVVVGNARIQMVHVVKANVSREELEHLRQLEIRASSQRSVAVFPVGPVLPVRVLELMLDIEQPDADRTGKQRWRYRHEQVLTPPDQPTEHPDQRREGDVGGDHAATHALAGPARHYAWAYHHRDHRPETEHHERVSKHAVAGAPAPT